MPVNSIDVPAGAFPVQAKLLADSSGRVHGFAGPGNSSSFAGPLQSGVWTAAPSICRLLLTGTGTITVDARNALGTITTGVASYTISGATNQIEQVYCPDDTVEVRVTLTGTATAEVLSGVGKSATPHHLSMFSFPFNQSGNNTVLPRDYSQNAVSASFGGSVAINEPWANAGYLTIAAGGGHYASIPAVNSSWDLNADSIILVATLNKAAPGSDEIFFGNCDTSSGSGNYGIALRADTTGKIAFRINADTFINTMASSTATVFDATPHQIMVALDGPSKTCKLYVDGVLDTTAASLWTAATNKTITNALNLGRTMTGNGVDCKFKGVQFLKFTNSSLPINVDELAKIAYAKPRTGILETDPVFM